MFDRDKSVISIHIKYILLEEKRVVAKNATVEIEGNRQIVRYLDYYNLDVIISVGYRVKSQRGVNFRKWVNQVLKQYLLTGYAISENRTLVTNENYIRLVNKNLKKQLISSYFLNFPQLFLLLHPS